MVWHRITVQKHFGSVDDEAESLRNAMTDCLALASAHRLTWAEKSTKKTFAVKHKVTLLSLICLGFLSHCHRRAFRICWCYVMIEIGNTFSAGHKRRMRESELSMNSVSCNDRLSPQSTYRMVNEIDGHHCHHKSLYLFSFFCEKKITKLCRRIDQIDRFERDPSNKIWYFRNVQFNI